MKPRPKPKPKPGPYGYREILDGALSRVRVRLLDRIFKQQLHDMAADAEAWKLILAGNGDVPVTIAPTYGVVQ